jgi:alkanesulfonate monooxygenase SsuD/methylene tetrahydromethanopterin reductase-like flavin-dependent oxidoreductase (luciferase family)
MLYFFQTLFSHGNLYHLERQRESGYVREENLSWLRPEHREEFLRTLQGFRRVTAEDLARNERLCWGTPEQVREALVGLAEGLGANTVLVQFNQGAMPHEMFVNQIKRFGEEVLPAVKQHEVTKVTLA